MNALAYIHWDVDPEIFRLGVFAVRWYGLFFALGFLLSYYVMARFFKKEGVQAELLDKLTMYMIIATIIGARLGHCLFYEPGYYLKNPLEILKIWEGGLASHGAAIAIIIALWLFARKYKIVSFFWVIDRIVICVALAGFFIRMGNLMNSEIIGKATSVPWAFVFERLYPVVQGPHHPTQIYEALSYFMIFLYLLWIYNKNQGRLPEAYLFSIFLITLFSVRFLIEFLKEVQVDFESTWALNLGQILSLPFIVAGILIFLTRKALKEQESE
jgi:phosphatidylglycerol---prolipoprotein diacylglyceryl transferase